MFRFEKLDVWVKAIEFGSAVYNITRRFPGEEKFGLTSQMRRASVSNSSNIAEGSGRGSDKDFARFIGFAYGSLMEVVSQARIALKEEFMTDEAHDQLYNAAQRLARMLSGLRSNLDGT